MSPHCIFVGNKRIPYTLTPAKKQNEYGEQVTHMKCEAADIDQEFLSEDIPALIADLPKLVQSEQEWKASQNQVIRFRVSAQDRQRIKAIAKAQGFSSVSAFARSKLLEST